MKVNSFDPIEKSLQLRSKDSWKDNLFFFDQSKSDLNKLNDIYALFLTSSSDTGVYRNGGRRGTQFGPQAIINCFGKLNYPFDKNNKTILIHEVFEHKKSVQNYELAQQESTEKINSFLLNWSSLPPLFHFGGGHDHIYPLTMALINKGIKNLTIINIDAHLDTRIDKFSHSGTPFSQINSAIEGMNTDIELIQIGIHRFANSLSTIRALENVKMNILGWDEMVNQTQYFKQPLSNYLGEKITYKDDRTYLLSLDCDALSSSFMEGVSAVNHSGFELQTLYEMVDFYMKFISHAPLIGLYEYNPIFDNLSQKGARSLAGLIYHILNGRII